MSTPGSFDGALADAAGGAGALVPVDVEPELTFFPSIEEMDAMPRGHGGRYTRADLRARRKGERGRPPGSRNKANVKFANYFIAKFGDPHDVMGEIMAMPLDALIEHMEAAQGGDAKHKPVRAIDAMRMKIEAADKVAPYVRGKQPISIEVTGRKDLVLLVPGLNVPTNVDPQTLSDAITEHGLAALDPESGELLMLPSPPDDDEGDDE